MQRIPVEGGTFPCTGRAALSLRAAWLDAHALRVVVLFGSTGVPAAQGLDRSSHTSVIAEERYDVANCKMTFDFC